MQNDSIHRKDPETGGKSYVLAKRWTLKLEAHAGGFITVTPVINFGPFPESTGAC